MSVKINLTLVVSKSKLTTISYLAYVYVADLLESYDAKKKVRFTH